MTTNLQAQGKPVDRPEMYTDGSYAAHNPTWHAEDAPWKAQQVMRVFQPPAGALRVCEVGCGVGGVLVEVSALLKKRHIDATLHGYDIAPQAIAVARRRWADQPNVEFFCEDVLAHGTLDYDVFMLIDVLEHLPNPVEFLKQLRQRGMRHCIVHLPLENYWSNIMRGRTDPRLSKVGHLHFYDTHSALSMLERAGLEVEQWVYTPELDLDVKLHRTAKSVAAYIPRKLLMMTAPALAVHTLGGAAFMARCRFPE